MQDLWGEAIYPQPAKQKASTHPKLMAVPLTAQDCFYFGHTWTEAGLSNEKRCTVCGVKGYCPGCTPLHTENDALPFFCTKHSQGRVEA